MSFREAIQYLESFINYEQIPAYPYKESLKLERVREFLQDINNPQDSLRCIHVAGTKGKGSTCAFVSYILRESGYKIGLYTSPHLLDFRERIRILRHQDTRTPGHKEFKEFEGMISKQELTGLVEKLKSRIEEYNKNSKYGPLSFFEVYTALAFVYFKEKKIDFAVLETGLGGKLDATNVVKPLVCAITPISYEHTQKLGNTLREIAREKAGIIKRQKTEDRRQKTIVISAPQEKEARDVIRKRCRDIGVQLYEVGKDIIYEKSKQVFNIKGILGEYKGLSTSLLGGHQLVNASVAVGIIEALRTQKFNVNIDSIRRGLSNTVWPGRSEVLSRNPLVVLDGAQNEASSLALKNTIKENFKYEKLILVLGISKDKDIRGICRQICPLADTIILTQSNNPRASSVTSIEQVIRSLKPGFRGQITKTKNVGEAKRYALQMAGKDDLILVTGSLFVVGEFRDEKI